MTSATDRIERTVQLKAPLSRVWRALSDPGEFGDWFGVALKGQRFAVGQRPQGQVTHPGYEHLLWSVVIERMEPERLLAWRWHPYPVEPGADHSSEPQTRVEFELDETADGTLLRIIESGFDQVPESRRMDAFRENSSGWDQQMRNIAAHVD